MLLPNGLPLHQKTLKNGLKITVIENHSAPVFSFQTWFRVGAKDEKLDPELRATGLAHLFEHMMFRGTASRPDGEFDSILSQNGVHDENATTWNDRTNYYQSLPADKLELVMELESDRMVNLVIDETLLETEKGAVLGEYRMGLDDPSSVASDHLYATAFREHPYRFTTIGTEAEIQGFTVEQARYFYRNYYAPNNAVLLLVGDVDPALVFALAEKHYGAFASQSVVHRVAKPEPTQTEERRMEFEHPQLETTKLVLGYRAPAVGDPDHAAFWIVQSLLTVGDGALLNSIWVNTGLASNVGGFLGQFSDPGLLIIEADLQPGKTPEELLEVLDRELRALPTRPHFQDDIERARNQLLLQIYSQWQENGDLASFLGEFLPTTGDLMNAFALVDQISGLQELAPIFLKYLVPSQRTVIVGRPK